MTREEAIKIVKENMHLSYDDGNTFEALKTLVPELRESEDERIRKEMLNSLKEAEDSIVFTPFKKKRWIAYLEKQKEQTEELSIRLNGLMQEYVKAGKDEEEQEHRLKCYQLFWDALGDSEFFKQKEQKPIKVYDNMDDLIADAMIDEISKSDMLDSCKHNRVYWINKHRQKPAECVADSIKFDEGFKTGREVGFREGVETSKPTEWSEEDEKMLDEVIKHVRNYQQIVNPANETGESDLTIWLKFLTKRFNLQPQQEWSEEDEKKYIDAEKLIAEIERLSFNNCKEFGNGKDLNESFGGCDAYKKVLSIITSLQQEQPKVELPEKYQTPDWIWEDKTIDQLAEEYVEGVKKCNDAPTWDLIHTAVFYGYELGLNAKKEE